jgi:NTE family protein
MEEGFYKGDRQQNYCVKCKKIDPRPIKEHDEKPRCSICGTNLRTKSTGLALSGGGFRAALFHLGSLWRLNELGWLKRLAEVTSVSGGSITAGYLGLHWKHLTFEADGVATNFVDEIVQPLRDFCSHTIELESVVAGLARPYRRGLFGKATLQNLAWDKEGPRFTIYATSLQTGVSVRFSQPYMAEYHLGKINLPDIQLATAVAASCAFPLFMRPITLRFNPSDWKDWRKGKKDDLLKNRSQKKGLRSIMRLDDGGVYDNLGLERIWDRYTTVLVSDAGAPLSVVEGSLLLQLIGCLRIKRPIDIVTEQTRRVRRRWLVSDLQEGRMQGAYWGIATPISKYKYDLKKRGGCAPPLANDNKTTRLLCRIRTRLNRFSIKEQEQLIDWGYALTDAAMRCYVLEKGAKPGRLPYPKRLI